MQIIPLKEFIKLYFKDTDEFARIHGMTRNSVYRRIAAGDHASGNRESYQIWKVSGKGGDQQNLF
ncbi:hypothetical protein [Vibrio harveyi]|jgi:hypothetical protein|uniref:hypothetical protein n=1 Tax=Vibrio harveyi TaxID=669 RepID=UPI0011C43860|nr:hypothetical protein [Vibrio harveyi]